MMINPCSNKRNVYHCDILYGTHKSDILRDFLYNKSFSKREKSCLIADEVDNMLVDCNSYITKLTDNSSGFDFLLPVRMYIWSQMNMFLLLNNGAYVDGLQEILLNQIRESIKSKARFFNQIVIRKN
jgi:hypothetical protein